MKYLSLLLISAAFTFVACKKQNKHNPVCDGSTPTYNSTISSIISSNCVSCHSEYGSYAGLSATFSDGSFEKEVLTDQSMPRNGELSNAELNTIKCWVENGFPEN